MYAIPTPLQGASDDGLTVAEILRALPTDPASIFVLILVIAAVVGVLYFGLRAHDSGLGRDDGRGPPPPAGGGAP